MLNAKQYTQIAQYPIIRPLDSLRTQGQRPTKAIGLLVWLNLNSSFNGSASDLRKRVEVKASANRWIDKKAVKAAKYR